ncbi:hypothetical protein CLOSTHATH_06301 [Hungatella hathewayi DSM 13479]|uniref:Uncharacterized protein n=1 Tax=Hungatella hathewayi DSM 13479 TaxID=566550 RepID=D3ARP5_9FIRM|nr:hypothetical protein CLOSTHATH_06301 [Hungatella hathewayi DSM 13479]
MKPPCTERYARWCERTGVNHSLLLDYQKTSKREKVPLKTGDKNIFKTKLQKY